MTINFRIIENPQPSYLKDYEKFIEYYNNPNMTVVDIRKKLGWTIKKYTEARKLALQEGKIKERRSSKKYSIGRPRKQKHTPKYYYYRKNIGKFIIMKRKKINKEIKYIYYGLYNTAHDCEKVIQELEKVNWDKTQLPLIREKLGLS